MSRYLGSALIALGLLVSSACGPPSSSGGGAGAGTGDPAESGAADGAVARSQARKLFAQRCVPCHGKEGAGNGPGATALNPKPRDFRDAAWQDSVTDQHILTIIRDGGGAVGKSAAMPPNPDLRKRPEVITGLKDIVRAFRR